MQPLTRSLLRPLSALANFAVIIWNNLMWHKLMITVNRIGQTDHTPVMRECEYKYRWMENGEENL